MIITVLNQTYNCGCQRGQNILESPGILKKLNSIIEWKYCTWPVKMEGDKEISDTKFLGDNPELKPGNCFLYSGQVIAVDSEDSLVLVLSETGVFALQRFYDDCIMPEVEILESHCDTDQVSFSVFTTSDEILSSCILDDSMVNYPIPYGKMIMFKERYMLGREFKPTGNCIEVSLENDDMFIIPVRLYILDWGIRYNKEELPDDEVLNIAINKVFAWFFTNTDRIVPVNTESEVDSSEKK